MNKNRLGKKYEKDNYFISCIFDVHCNGKCQCFS